MGTSKKQIKVYTGKAKLLCWLGIHRWTFLYGRAVPPYEVYYCERCGKDKTVVFV